MLLIASVVVLWLIAALSYAVMAVSTRRQVFAAWLSGFITMLALANTFTVLAG